MTPITTSTRHTIIITIMNIGLNPVSFFDLPFPVGLLPDLRVRGFQKDCLCLSLLDSSLALSDSESAWKYFQPAKPVAAIPPPARASVGRLDRIVVFQPFRLDELRENQ